LGIRHDLVVLSDHYKIAHEIFLTYVDISRKYILPGVGMVERLSQGSVAAEDVGNACKKIAKYTEDCRRDINEVVKTKTKDLNEQFIDDAREFEIVE